MRRIILLPALIAGSLALAGCAAGDSPDAPTSDACEVTVVVDFGVLDAPSVEECVAAGPALDVLDAAGVTTEGTADYGDAVVCRVNREPAPDEQVAIPGEAPFVESCATLNAVAYWALWVKPSADADWEYAQEGLTTLELAPGQAVGLVYTVGTDSVPPGE